MTGRFLIRGITLLLLCAGAVVGLLIFVEVKAAPYIYSSIESAPTSTAALVLGASVYRNGELSPVLAARADRAIELYRAGKVKKILVTGDNGELSHNEVNPVGNYLLSHGIPKPDIFLDHAGFDTYSSMYRARDVFDIRNVLIVSQPFHLARAVFIARQLGIAAAGVEASGEATPYNTLREVPATVKAVVDLVLKRYPRYLGAQYPITGDGGPTWADATTTPEEPLH
jgi:SanA protein